MKKRFTVYDKWRVPISVLSGFLVLISLVVALMPLSYGSTTTHASSAASQGSRSSALAKNVLLLADETQTGQTRTQARDDMQIALPEFEKEQGILLKNRDQAAQVKLLVARPSYLRLVQAIHTILASEGTPDSAQVSIVIENSRAYNIAMNQYLLVLQQNADDWNAGLAIIQCGLIVAIVACFVGYNLVNRHERKALRKAQ